MLKVVLLGGGNIAYHLFTAFGKLSSVNLIQCYNRNIHSIEEFGKFTQITDDINSLEKADIYIIAVTDDAIGQVSDMLPFSDNFVVHTSGNVSMYSMNAKNRRGVLYPLQTFSKEKLVDFGTLPICIEAEDEKDFNFLKAFSSELSTHVYEINSEQRKVIHLAAVFVNNFVNHLYYIGHELCEKNNVPFNILHPLIEETTHKIMDLAPKEAQTGPAKRNDQSTINAHLEQLPNKNYKEIYKLLTASIQNTYGRKKL
ncbi:Rossmann-like and DUF2520 domain-containing protein [Galbibacter pacificus]|uniref:DUF2520 domain-containing protein n=1 Tax=Galbibacter pacificus TaxID=2996052 RepID=A0ABT6FQW0_9FLAO|nr:DUF2520 domain-containing protein [Galbibacter pacificus]MDG3581869.1 DUF2520 domain-containing protein [Galbibacter pacificus]MDG3585657.1 DUF2520 domain-containing protein [Galbibacter pacificus]